MGAGVHRSLYVEHPSPLHRLAPSCKILSCVLFVFAVVATPREAFWAFALYAVVVFGLATIAGLGSFRLLRRLVVELPFLLFALLLPFVGRGERIDVVGLSLSVDGLWGAWNILAKASLGVAASAVLAATTNTRDLLVGFERLRVPKVLTGIVTFMLRYAEIIAGDLRAMRIARESRGYEPHWIWHARAVATSAGALFVRSYERGERVYLAMVSRGYNGSLPDLAATPPSTGQWFAALVLPLGAAVVATLAWTTLR